MQDNEYTHCGRLLSYNCPFNVWYSLRSRGKTTGAKILAVKRFYRKHRPAVWIRVTDEEMQTAKRGFWSKKFIKIMNKHLKPNQQLTEDNVRIMGDTAQIKIRGKWVKVIEFCALSTYRKQRSVDDFYSVAILDEGNPPLRSGRSYHGNMIDDLIDLYISKKREEDLQLLIMGNRENETSAFFNYFGLIPPPLTFEGYERYRDKTIAVFCDLREPCGKGNFDSKVRQALQGTKAGLIMYRNELMSQVDITIKAKPKNATHYCSFDFGTPFTMWITDGRLYCTAGVDQKRVIVTDTMGRGYKDTLVYTTREKHRFSLLMNVKRNNGLYYQNQSVKEIVTECLRIMTI